MNAELNVSLSRHVTPTLKYKLYTIAQTPHELWQILDPGNGVPIEYQRQTELHELALPASSIE